jgi:hypothetical protein
MKISQKLVNFPVASLTDLILNGLVVVGGLVAQLVEQRAFNSLVLGSSPSETTMISPSEVSTMILKCNKNISVNTNLIKYIVMDTPIIDIFFMGDEKLRVSYKRMEDMNSDFERLNKVIDKNSNQ